MIYGCVGDEVYVFYLGLTIAVVRDFSQQISLQTLDYRNVDCKSLIIKTFAISRAKLRHSSTTLPVVEPCIPLFCASYSDLIALDSIFFSTIRCLRIEENSFY